MWQTVKLNDIVNISIGKTPPRGDKRYWDREKNTKNIWLSIADMNSVTDGFVSDSKEYVSNAGAALFKPVPAGTLIMSFKLSIGKLAFTACELRTNEAIAALEIKDENQITKEYLKYFLSSRNWDKIAGDDAKVKGKTLNKAKLKELEVVVPPLAEQHRIVAKLDAAFAEIDDERERVFLKMKNAQSLFSNILETEFSQISNNYSFAKLGEVCAKIQDGAHHSPKQLFDEQADNQFPYITAKNIRTNWMKLEPIQYVNEDFHNAIYKKCDVKFGDVLLTKDGASTGNICLNEIDEPISLLSSVCLIRGEESVLSNQYVCFYLQSPTGFSAVTGSMTGAAIKRIILKRIKQTQIPLAPLHEQHKLNEKLLSILKLISDYQNSLEKIADNYTSLKSAILAQELQSEAA